MTMYYHLVLLTLASIDIHFCLLLDPATLLLSALLAMA
jgi:hypothetical protein